MHSWDLIGGDLGIEFKLFNDLIYFEIFSKLSKFFT
jgi:hypothetical protein